MKKLFVGISILLTVVLFGQDFRDLKPKGIKEGRPQLTRFRKMPFGSSKQYVIENEKEGLEKKELHKGVDVLRADTYLLGKECSLYYTFVGDRLLMGAYLITEKHTNENHYIDDYNDIKEALKEKYGSGFESDVDWQNHLYSNKPERYGFAVSVGHLVYTTLWKFPNGRIQLKLSGDNYKIELHVAYILDEFYHERDKYGAVENGL